MPPSESLVFGPLKKSGSPFPCCVFEKTSSESLSQPIWFTGCQFAHVSFWELVDWDGWDGLGGDGRDGRDALPNVGRNNVGCWQNVGQASHIFRASFTPRTKFTFSAEFFSLHQSPRISFPQSPTLGLPSAATPPPPPEPPQELYIQSELMTPSYWKALAKISSFARQAS